MRLFGLAILFVSANSECFEKKRSWKDCQNWASFMPGSYWTWNPENEKCLLKSTNNHMENADGFHSGDHSGSKHWKDKKIPHQGCGNCGPVLVEIINNTTAGLQFHYSVGTIAFCF